MRLVDRTEEGKYLLSIIGINYISAAGLLSELGSFRSYRSAKQLIKMAGSNPTESESGGKRGSYTPMSRQGRPALRNCAWTAVIPMLRFNPTFAPGQRNYESAQFISQETDLPPDAASSTSYKLGGSHNISGGRGDAAVPFGSPFEPTRQKTWCPAFLSKPV